MMSLRNLVVSSCAAAGFLALSLAAPLAVAQEIPAFESISVQGEVSSGAPQEPDLTYMRYHAKFKMNGEGGERVAGICDAQECEFPDVSVNTTLYLGWPPGVVRNLLPWMQMVVSLKVMGGCFVEGQFEMNEKNVEECVEAFLETGLIGAESKTVDSFSIMNYDMKHLLKVLKMQLMFQGGKRGRFMGEAAFTDPGFPYPVAGFGGLAGPSAGTQLCIGAQCGSAPFGGVGFVGSAGEEICEPIEPDPASQGFWKRQCKGAHPSGEADRLESYLLDIGATETFSGVGSVDALCAELDPQPRNSACEKAETQFMALLLNLASGRVVTCNCIADPATDAGTVGEAVAAIDALLGSGANGDCKLAQAVAARINEGISLTACP